MHRPSYSSYSTYSSSSLMIIVGGKTTPREEAEDGAGQDGARRGRRSRRGGNGGNAVKAATSGLPVEGRRKEIFWAGEFPFRKPSPSSGELRLMGARSGHKPRDAARKREK